MKGLVAGILLSAGTILGQTQSTQSLSEEYIKKLSLEKEVTALLDSCWNKEFHVTEKDLEKEISKWPQELADYMKDVTFILTPRRGDIVASFMLSTNTYFIPYMRINADNFPHVMKNLRDTVHTNEDIQDLDMVNYYSLAVREIKPSTLQTLENDLKYYIKQMNYFLEFSRESVSHEMGHRLLHDSDGLASRDDYYFPSNEDFRQYATHLLSTDARDAMIEKCGMYLIQSDWMLYFVNRYGTIDNFFENVMKSTDEKIKVFNSVYGSILRKDSFEDLVWINGYMFSSWADSLGRENEKVKFIEGLNEGIRLNDVVLLDSTYNGYEYAFREKPYFKMHMHSKEGTDYYKIVHDEKVEWLIQQGLKPEEYPDFYWHSKDLKIFKLLRQEIEATVIAALSLVHLNESSSHMWPVDYTGLDYFSKFKIGEERIFQRFIEKNMIAKYLVEKGTFPADARQRLEFATEYMQGRKQYEWPSSEIEISIIK